MRRIEPTPELKSRILDRIERGWTIVRVGREPGFPTQPVISRWARQDAAFGAALKRAYEWRRVVRTEHLSAPSFHWETAQAFLEKVRRAERMRPRPDVGG